jgi:hypothetical protein
VSTVHQEECAALVPAGSGAGVGVTGEGAELGGRLPVFCAELEES